MTSKGYSELVYAILGLKEQTTAELNDATDKIFRYIDKYDIGAVDFHVFKRELIKMNSEIETVEWKRFLAFLGTGIDNKVCKVHLQKAIKKHLRVLYGMRTTRGLSSINHSDRERNKSNSFVWKRKGDCVWVRGDATLNRLSGTSLFDMSVVNGSSLRHTYQVFCDMNEVDNGFMTLRGLKNYMNRHAVTMLPITTSLFNAADKHRQGSVTFEELMHSLYPSCFKSELERMISIARPDHQPTNIKMDSSTIEDVKDIFKVYDDNGDNTLDLEEFCSALTSLGFLYNDAQEVFSQIDQDSSGIISLEEFLKWYTNNNNNNNSNSNTATNAQTLSSACIEVRNDIAPDHQQYIHQ